MKNQYFGDINDYRKYGLLRLLSGDGRITTAVCWMLTPDDGGTDGKLTAYLNDPDKWSGYDHALYDYLRELVLGRKLRHVPEIEDSDILPGYSFFSDLVPDNSEHRDTWFQRLLELAKGCDLIFFDPDNGIEVPSKRYGLKDSSKYVYWREIEDAFNAGHSLLIYQHFPREELSFRTPHVLFLLAPQEQRREFFRERSEKVEAVWGSQIAVVRQKW